MTIQLTIYIVNYTIDYIHSQMAIEFSLFK